MLNIYYYRFYFLIEYNVNVYILKIRLIKCDGRGEVFFMYNKFRSLFVIYR